MVKLNIIKFGRKKTLIKSICLNLPLSKYLMAKEVMQQSIMTKINMNEIIMDKIKMIKIIMEN
jgi:hypothetical protein